MSDNLKYWMAVNRIENLGPVTIKKLWDRFGSIKAVWEADEKSILEIEGLNKTAVKAFLEARNQLSLESELDAVLRGNIKVLTLEDKVYPYVLKAIYDPPPVLYVKGNILEADKKALAIVGTRRPSRYGLETAKQLALELAAAGITIVSGLAAGIDTAAHKGALEAKGRTIAVFGCGVDVVFPPANRSLAKEIELSGALVSEFPLGTKAEKGYFPRRNRIISGLSLGVIVVEGYYDSGAMITAKLALEQGREVFAVPGPIGSNLSKGPHWLIKQGAKLVETVDDIFEELNLVMPASRKRKEDGRKEKADYSNLPEKEQATIKILSRQPKHIDDIALEIGFSPAEVSSLLMLLEIKKLVRQLPGKLFMLE